MVDDADVPQRKATFGPFSSVNGALDAVSMAERLIAPQQDFDDTGVASDVALLGAPLLITVPAGPAKKALLSFAVIMAGTGTGGSKTADYQLRITRTLPAPPDPPVDVGPLFPETTSNEPRTAPGEFLVDNLVGGATYQVGLRITPTLAPGDSIAINGGVVTVVALGAVAS